MASNELARLIVKLEAQTGQYDANLKKATRELNKFRKEAGTALGKMEKQFAAFGQGITRALGLGSLTAAVYGLTRAVGSAINTGDELQKFAVKAGLTAEAASELAHAAKMVDLDLTALATGLKKMQVTLSEAGSGTKSATETFAALGLSFDKLKALQPDRQFELIAEQISKLKSPADKTRAAVELFGKAGADLLPLFEQGAEGIRKAREEAQRLGLSFSGENLKALANTDDSVKRLKGSFASLANTLTVAAAPALTGFFDVLRMSLGGATAAEGLAMEIAKLEKAGMIFGENAAKLEQMRSRLNDLLNYRSTGPQRRGRNSMPEPEGFKAAEKVVKDIEKSKPEIIDFNRLMNDTETDLQGATRAYEEFLAKLQLLFDTRFIEADEFKRRLDEFVEKSIPEVEVTAKKIEVEKALDEMTVFADQAARNMQDHFAQFLFDPFEDGLKGMLRGFIDTLRQMVANEAAAGLFDWLSGKGGGVNILGSILGGIGGAPGSTPTVPRLAGGGPVTAGKPHIVGEAGPELFVPGMSGQIIPNDGFGSITIHQPIDARGATMELAKALPAILQENNRRLVENLRDAKTRGAF